jgi:hypothetical protein
MGAKAMSSNPLIQLGGLGLTPHFGPGPAEKKFSSSDCLQALMDKIQAEPEIVRNQFNIVSREQSGEMQATFWPAIFDASNWTRIETRRPTKDAEGNHLHGTDREVRVYENDFWADERKSLIGTVMTERGEIAEITVVAKW